MIKRAKLLISLNLVILAAYGCVLTQTPEEKLERMGVKFDAESFLQQTSAGNSEAVKLFIRGGIDLESKNQMGKTALIIASTHGHTGIVKMLLTKGAEINAKDIFDVTPLIASAWHGRSEILQVLIDRGADVNTANSAGITALMWSADYPGGIIAEKLTSNGADVHAQAKDGWTAVTWAGLRESLNNLRILSENGAVIDHKDPEYGRTPLMEAAAAGKHAGVKKLLSLGAGVNMTDRDGYTPLMYAAAMNNARIVKTLLENGADPNIRDGRGVSALLIAQTEIHVYPEIIKSLLASGAEITPLENEKPDIFIFSAFGNTKKIKTLIDSRDSLPDSDKAGWSPLMWAVISGSQDAVKLLAESSDVNRVNDYGLSPLLIAVMDNSPEIITLLKESGADIEQTTPQGLTPLAQSIYSAGIQTVDMLLELGAEVNVKTPEGMTPLMFSVLTGDIEKVRLLLENGADVHAIENTQKLTARMIAENLELHEIEGLLKDEEKTPDERKII